MHEVATATGEAEPRYAGFWIRVWAMLVDSFLLSLVASPLLCSQYGRDSLDPARIVVAGPGEFFASWVFPALAVIFFWRYYQATPGKMLISAKVVDAVSGEKPSLGQCVGRYFAYIPSAFFFGIGVIWVAFDARKQGWHDKLAGTVVIREKRRGEPVPQDGSGI